MAKREKKYDEKHQSIVATYETMASKESDVLFVTCLKEGVFMKIKKNWLRIADIP